MSHILKGLSKRNTHIPRIVLYDEDKWQKVCSNAYFGFFTGGGHFWRVTQQGPLDYDACATTIPLRIDYCGLGPILNNGSIFGTVTWI